MRWGGAGLIAVVLALAGCKSTDPKPTDKDTAGTPASRAKNDGKAPSWLDSGDGYQGGVGDGRNSGGSDSVSGRVLDQSNRPVAGVYIQVEAVNPPPGTPAPVGITTDQNGSFVAYGLKPGKTYNLTAEATLSGKAYTAAVQTIIPKNNIALVLRDEPGLPPVGISKGNGSFPPAPSPYEPGSDRIPPVSFGQPAPRSTDGAWAPGGDASRQVPTAIPPYGQKPTQIPAGSMPAPDDLTAPPTKPVSRPENVADRPVPWNSPPANIPGPTTPGPNNPPPPPSPPDPLKTGVSGNANGFILLDTVGRSWQFPANKSGSVTLVQFMTTTCPHSKRSVTLLTDLQARYATAGLQVIGVACDTEEDPKKPAINERQRMEAASAYMRDNSLNYQLYVEPGEVAGGVRNRYKVEFYPTVVLLDATGSVLWKGHPYKNPTELEAAISKRSGNNRLTIEDT